MPSFGHWVYTADRDATIEAYSQIERGGADRCDCAWCRNFRKVRPQVFPSEFLALLGVLGIDPNKDAEVYHIARPAPGRHYYGGWYHFVGNLDETGDFPPIHFGTGFTTWMSQAAAPRLPSLKGLPVVELAFSCETVPWLLDEPEGD
jgi:hypothetical protein